MKEAPRLLGLLIATSVFSACISPGAGVVANPTPTEEPPRRNNGDIVCSNPSQLHTVTRRNLPDNYHVFDIILQAGPLTPGIESGYTFNTSRDKSNPQCADPSLQFIVMRNPDLSLKVSGFLQRRGKTILWEAKPVSAEDLNGKQEFSVSIDEDNNVHAVYKGKQLEMETKSLEIGVVLK